MANPYPADVADSGGNVRLSGAITFTDPDNQPGGSSSPLSVIGPYRFNYNDPGIAVNGIILAAIPAGTTLIKAWAVIRTDWHVSGGDIDVEIMLGPTADWESNANFVVKYASGINNPAELHREMAVGQPPTETQVFSSVAAVASSLGVFASGAFTSGASDLYALLWTPA